MLFSLNVGKLFEGKSTLDIRLNMGTCKLPHHHITNMYPYIGRLKREILGTRLGVLLGVPCGRLDRWGQRGGGRTLAN